jgi:hypothetical protein
MWLLTVANIYDVHIRFSDAMGHTSAHRHLLGYPYVEMQVRPSLTHLVRKMDIQPICSGLSPYRQKNKNNLEASPVAFIFLKCDSSSAITKLINSIRDINVVEHICGIVHCYLGMKLLKTRALWYVPKSNCKPSLRLLTMGVS